MDLHTRGYILKVLSESGDDNAISLLIKVATDDSADAIRRRAIASLGVVGDDRAVPALVSIGSNESNPSPLRARALGLLGHINTTAARTALLSLENDALVGEQSGQPTLDWLVRSEQLWARGEVDDEFDGSEKLGAFPLNEWGDDLVAIVQNPRNGAMARGNAIVALAMQGAPQYQHLYLPWILDEKEDPLVRGAAAWATGVLGDLEATAELVEVVRNARADTILRSAAVISLGKLGGDRVVEALLVALQEPAMRRAAGGFIAKALGRLGDGRAVQSLIDMLSDEDGDAVGRGFAAQALARIGNPLALNALILAVRDARLGDRSRNLVIEAIGKFLDTRAVDALINLVKDSDEHWTIRMTAASQLGRIGDHRATDAVIGAFSEAPQKTVRMAFAIELGRLRDAAAVKPLAAVLRETKVSSTLKGRICRVLGHIGDASAVTALIEAAGDKNMHGLTRAAAADALARIGDARAGDVLACMLEDASLLTAVRSAAAKALGRIGDPMLASSLVRVTEDQNVDTRLRRTCTGALGYLPASAALFTLDRILKDETENPHILSAAVEALTRIGGRETLTALIASVSNRIVFGGAKLLAVKALAGLGDKSALPVLRALAEDTQQHDTLRGEAVAAYVVIDRAASEWLIAMARASMTSGFLHASILNAGSIFGKGAEWLKHFRRTACFDRNFRNRAMTVQILEKRGDLDADTVHYLIDPNATRHDRCSRDPDNGVRGVCAAAVLRHIGRVLAKAPQLVDIVFNLLADPDAHPSVIDGAMAGVRTFTLEHAEMLLDEFDKRLSTAAHALNLHFLSRTEQLRSNVRYRSALLKSESKFRQEPENALRAFHRSSRIEPEAVTMDGPRALFVTATQRERTEVLATLQDAYRIVPRVVRLNGRLVDVFEWPCINGRNWQITLAQPSDKGPLPMQALVVDMINGITPPSLILMLGCCAGLPERGVQLGDVILARRIHGYQRKRHEAGEITITPDSYLIEAELGERVNHSLSRPEFVENVGCRVHFKDFASSEDLINDPASSLRSSIMNLSPEILGFEMEGQGLAHSLWEARRRPKAVLGAMVKGISDFGDGNMTTDKAQLQATATRHALRVALELLRGDIDQPIPAH